MTGIKIDFGEVQRMQLHLDNVLPEAIQDGLNQAALLTRGEAVKEVQRPPKTGRVYKRGSLTHQASAPGEAPATDTGSLASSIKADTKQPASVRRARDARSVAGSTIKYSEYLEDGTSTIAPRPFMFPAFVKVRKRIVPLVRRAAKKRLRLNP